MHRILHISASPRGDQSDSRRLAEAFLARLGEVAGEIAVDTFELFDGDLPEFTAPAAAAKYAVMSGEEPTDEAGRAWADVIAVVDRLKAADAVVIASPMWNFSIPYRLKQYIDVITQPGLTFSYTPESGYTGLITGRPAALMLSRGGDYGEGTGLEQLDMQTPYLKLLLGFLGFEAIDTVVAQPTALGDPATVRARFAQALDEARALAEGFLVKQAT